MAAASTTILWRRLDTLALEWCQVSAGQIDGVVVAAEGDVPWRVEYAIELDAEGRTRRVRIEALTPDEQQGVGLSADGAGHWQRNGRRLFDAPEAIDVDLGFSPVTNSLPIWRLGLGVGESRELAVAWVQFPSFEVILGRQTYTRLAERRWRYASAGFSAELDVGEDGLVERYEGLWEAVLRG